MTDEGRPKRTLTEAEIEESVRFADGCSAAAGHFVDDPAADDQVRKYLHGNLTLDEHYARALAHAMGPGWTPPERGD